MALARDMNIKPSCLAELRGLPAHMAGQVWEKIDFLAQNPIPDGRLKKKLAKWPDSRCSASLTNQLPRHWHLA